MIVTSKTKISAILKANPEAIETIASINTHFNKLRNPILRKLLAGRVDVESAAKIGGVSTELFLERLATIGFKTEQTQATEQTTTQTTTTTPQATNEKPQTEIDTTNCIDFDVRPILDGGEDPFKHIMSQLQALPAQGVLRVINHFKPSPLISILENKGYTAHVENPEENLFYTYLQKQTNTTNQPETEAENPTDFSNFETVRDLFVNKTIEIDVRQLDMPEPMVTILGELAKLPADHCLYVHHKKMPQFLIPELKERNFVYLTQEQGPGEVKIIILKNPAK